jgi:diadenosine tetraphosphatase ApaH/serine/threonine PP2A family protein phosphatase
LVWKECTDTFDYLPLAGVIDNHMLAIHGGLSPLLSNLNDLA